MNSANLQRALTQTLKNYARCGIRRFERSEGAFSPDAQAALDAWEAEQIALSSADSENSNITKGTASVTSAGAAAPPSSVPGAANASPPAATTVAPSPRASAQLGAQASQGNWTLPIMTLAERELEFATLDQQVKQCRRCENIVDFRQQTVFGTGNLSPTICFLGEAPGADEDRQGKPFVGRAGQLLSKIIAAMKLERDEVYILNALKCRPPQNRTPLPEEIENCRGFVQRQLEVLRPQYIVCLGAVAVRALLDSTSPIGLLRGKFHPYREAKVVVTYHPSYLLRNENAKRLVWDDMKMLLAEIASPGP